MSAADDAPAPAEKVIAPVVGEPVLGMPPVAGIGDLSPTAEPMPGIRRAALRGAVWIGAGFGAMYLLRLASGIILTRLVDPGIYGLMDIAMVFIQGVHMFVDLGIGTGIIQSKHGDDPGYLNTAWTLQVLRGLGLWTCTGLIAWPVATFYHQPVLMFVIPAIGATAAIDGFNSTALFTLSRRLVRGPLVALEVGVQTFGLLVTLAWMLWVEPTVWGFVIGSVLTSLLNMTLTHVVLGGARNWFRWDAAAAHELIHFGKWVLVGTMITFLAFQSERLIVSRAGGPELMGVFGRALSLAGIATGLMSTFATQLVLPTYSRMHQSGHEIRNSFWKVHGSAAGFGAFLVTGMLATGPAAVDFMYGDLFHDAGWMLQFSAAGAWFQMLEGTIGASLFALGRSRSVTVGNATRLFGVLVFVPTGYWLGHQAGFPGPLDGGFIGMLLGFFVADFVRYVVVVWLARQNGMSAPGCDVVLTLAILIICPLAAYGGDLVAGPLSAQVRHPKVHALVVFLCQAALVVLAWGLLGLLWYRKALGLRLPWSRWREAPSAG